MGSSSRASSVDNCAVGAKKETTSAWVVIASVGVVALAGFTLRTDGPRDAVQRVRRFAQRDALERIVREQQRARVALNAPPGVAGGASIPATSDGLAAPDPQAVLHAR